MVAYIFQELAKKGIAAGITKARSEEAREWFRNESKTIKSVIPREIMLSDTKRLKSSLQDFSIGRMYMFYYDAKTKEDLPYWDRFPLIFVLELYQDGFLGINLHYLPPILRAKLMDKLYDTINNNKYDDSTKLKISYQILKSASQFKLFKPCLKKYLTNHVRSKFFTIDVNRWDMALMLPTERFEKKTKYQVWKESTKAVK